MKKTNIHTNQLLLFLFVIYLFTINLIIAQKPNFPLSEQPGLIKTEQTLLQENDWTLQHSNNHYFGTISKLSFHGMAYLGSDKILLFGGIDAGRLQETFIYDLSQNSWTWKNLSTLPENRQNMGMAHIGGDKVILFRGQRQYANWLNDTWIFDYSENKWTQQSPGTKPTARKIHSMAYIGDDKVLLFGGYTNALNDETWIYDLSENNWLQINPGTAPSAREGHAMAYIGGDEVILFGGNPYGLNIYSDETWIYDLSQGNWTEKNPATKPEKRHFHDIAYIGNGQVVLYGGINNTTTFNDTWVYNLNDNSWTEDINGIGTTPGNRFGHGLCETSMDGSTKPVLFGGKDDNLDTWIFGGGDYLNETSEEKPPPTNLISLNGYHKAIPLTWKAPSSRTPQGYNIYRNSQKIASNVTRTYYRDQTVTNGQSYNYQVTAVYSDGESDFSNDYWGNTMLNGYYIHSGWASSLPNIDGTINSAEWSDAAITNISYPGNSGTVRLYVMNDNNYLYFAVDDDIDNSLDNDDTFGIVFDDNHDRELPLSSPSNEGLIQIYWNSSASNSYLGTYGYFPDNLSNDGWTTPSGVSQGITLTSGHMYYEGRIDLNNSPLKSSPGNNIGITFYTWDGSSSSFTGIWPEALLELQNYTSGFGWFYGPFSYGDIKLSSTEDIPGSKKWEFLTGHNISSSPAIGSDGTIYTTCHDRKIYAINPNGTKKWDFLTGAGIASSPTIGSDGTIYSGSDDNKLYALNSNGTKKWEFEVGHRIRTSPAIALDGTIYFGSADKKFYAINPNGTKKWEFETMNWIENSSPAISSDGTIYVGSWDSRLYAINSDGTKKWDIYLGTNIHSSPAINSDGTIYVGSDNFNLYAINPDGTKKWEFETGHKIFSSPAIGSDGTIYVGSHDKKLYAINPNGTKKWEFETGDLIYKSSPAIGSDGTIYVGSSDKKLYAINPNGTKKWEFEAGDKVFSNPTIGSVGTIYVGSDDNKLIAVNGNSGGLAETPWPMFQRNVRHTGRAETSSSISLAVRFAAPGDFVEVEHSNSIAPSEFTIEFWLRVNDLGDPQIAGGEQTIMDKRGDNNTGYNIRLAGTTFPISLHAIAGTQSVSTDNIVFQYDWYHIAVTQDSDSLKLYFDGEQISVVGNVYPANTNSSLRIGEFLGYPGTYLGLRGDIDEMRIWNYVRSKSDIQAMMYEKLSGFESGLAAYWTFDSESGGIIPDLTVNGNDGVMHGNAILIDSEIATSVEENNNTIIPKQFVLWQNYPNPFNPSTTIKYNLVKEEKVGLSIYNLLGQKVVDLVNAHQSAGIYSIIWDGKDAFDQEVASGIYIYRIKTGSFVQTKKMAFVQ